MKVRSVPKNQKKGRPAEARPVQVPETMLTAPEGQGRGGLRVEAERATESALKIAALQEGLGAPAAGQADEERVYVEVDPKAHLLAGIMTAPLKRAPKVEQAAKITGPELAQTRDKFAGMATLHGRVVEGEQKIEQSRQVLGHAQRDLRGKLDGVVKELLTQERLDGDLRRRLNLAYGRVEEKKGKLKAAQAEKKAETVAEAGELKAELKAKQRREHLLRTMLEVKHGADPERAAEAVAAYTDLAEGAERRDRGR